MPTTTYTCTKCGTSATVPVLSCGCGVAVTASIAASMHGVGGLRKG